MSAAAPFMLPAYQGSASLLEPLYGSTQSQVIEVKKETPAPKPEVVAVAEVIVEPTPQVVTYEVQEGDNLSRIADKYQTSWERLWQANNQLQNQDQLSVGDTITIPGSDETLPERALGASVSVPSVKVELPTGTKTISTFRSSGGANTYAYGWCTWWVKEKRPDIGGYWGNAGYAWISQAQASGFNTGSTPVPGAIGVTAGHVVYVESVNGSTINISEMGYGYRASAVNYRTTSASSFTYIY